MLNSKFLFTLVGLVLAIFAICKMDANEPVVENWWGNASFGVKAIPGVKTASGHNIAVGGNYLNQNTMGSGKFFQVPNFQSMLSPRMGNVQYGANIRYNAPDQKNLAVPCDPLTFGDMAQENYQPEPVKENYGCGGSGGCGSGSVQSCGKGGIGGGKEVGCGYELPSGFTNGNYQKVYDSLPYKHAGGDCDPNDPSSPCNEPVWGSGSLPIGTMDVMDGAGNQEQIVTYNNFMFANKQSKLRAHGDMIRGDLAITPCQTGWFSVYPNINIDLQAGAMNVMSGANAGNSALLELMVKASGGVQNTFAGVDLSEQMSEEQVNMSNQAITSLSSALGDVSVTAFP